MSETEETVPCEHCQGNGELVTDWGRYLRGPLDENGEDAVAPCPHCYGTGDVHRADGEWLGECTCLPFAGRQGDCAAHPDGGGK